MPFPFRKIDRLELAKAEWRSRAVERNRDQLVRITAESGLVAHPCRLHRIRRPKDDNGIAIFQGLLDLGREARPATDVVFVAPDVMAFALEPFAETLRLCAVLSRIAEEELCHAAPDCMKPALLPEDADVR